MREPIKGFGLLSDFALRKARTALGRERMTRAHPVLEREAVDLRGVHRRARKNVDKVLRKHGSEIAEMQYTQKRVADMAIDLYAIAACISRTTRAIEKRGEEGARREIDLTTVFVAARRAPPRGDRRRVRQERRRAPQGRRVTAYADGGYPLRHHLSASSRSRQDCRDAKILLWVSAASA